MIFVFICALYILYTLFYVYIYVHISIYVRMYVCIDAQLAKYTLYKISLARAVRRSRMVGHTYIAFTLRDTRLWYKLKLQMSLLLNTHLYKLKIKQNALHGSITYNR